MITRTLLSAVLVAVCAGFLEAQNYWRQISDLQPNQKTIQTKRVPDSFKLFELDIDALNKDLQRAPNREKAHGKTDLVLEFPNDEGQLEKYRIMEAPVMHPDLAAKYPGIESYAGKGIDDPSATIRFSFSQVGFHGMIMSGTRSTFYIDPYTEDKKVYQVYSRNVLDHKDAGFECLTPEDTKHTTEKDKNLGKATDDKRLRKYRLALSCTAEYGNIFAGGGSTSQQIANILAQMNVTMTRVNGVYERDLAITLELVPNNDEIIYFGNTNSDPWANEYNNTTQDVIDDIIGNNNYDIGHNFNTTGGGNAGCIGCVCTTGEKGSAYTGRADPTGDPFDIDYVAHEMGHQFGGYHTMNTCSRSGSGSTEVEPTSASTIMGYAGICDFNIQNNSDDYFAYVNIRDISANIQNGESSGCPEIIDLSNDPPTADAGPNYTIPNSTPFVLRGTGTDPDGDVLTYTWEQNDPERAPGSGTPSSSWTTGPLFRSITGTTSPNRYMPNLDAVVNNTTPTYEVLPSVARSMEFSLTVKDNAAGGGQTDDDLVSITVNGSAGPFLVNTPNSAVTWFVGGTQTVTWDVSGTNSSPVNCANVNILLSIDGGYTYPITLASNTPNDGSQTIVVPGNTSSSCRIMVEAADNIFYDISNTDFAIEGAVDCTPTVPTGLIASNITSNSATLSWSLVTGAGYDLQYREAGTTTWTTLNGVGNPETITGLAPLTVYEAQVRSVCTDGNSAYSTTTTFTTTEVVIEYCSSNGNDVSDEYISNVQLNTIDNTTGADPSGYADFTAISTNLEQGTDYTITITPVWTGQVYSEGYAVWIDYNIDGDFDDAGEQVWSLGATQNTPVSGSFTIPSTATEGATRMRVSMKYNAIPTSCESFAYGEVEDYTVVIGTGSPDTQAPTTPTNLTSSAITTSSFDVSWNASSDNVGVTSYNVYLDGSLDGTTSGTVYSFSGLQATTSYDIAVEASDAAGNTSGQASINVTTDDDTVNPCPILDITGITSYGGTQDADGDFSISNGELFLENNTWKYIAYDYTVTANTVIEFEFRSTSEGEIHGIGFDDNNSISSNFTVKIYGTQNWGITNYDNYSGTDWVQYSIPLGALYTGSFDRLFFVNDNDAGSGNNSYFRNVYVGESACEPTAFASKGGDINVIIGSDMEIDLTLFPNPVQDQLNLVHNIENGTYSIISLNGSIITSGIIDSNLNAINTSFLDKGIYLLKIESESLNYQVKLIK